MDYAAGYVYLYAGKDTWHTGYQQIDAIKSYSSEAECAFKKGQERDMHHI